MSPFVSIGCSHCYSVFFMFISCSVHMDYMLNNFQGLHLRYPELKTNDLGCIEYAQALFIPSLSERISRKFIRPFQNLIVRATLTNFVGFQNLCWGLRSQLATSSMESKLWVEAGTRIIDQASPFTCTPVTNR